MNQLFTYCGLPLLAVVVIAGLFILLGMLIDPEGMIDWYNNLKKFYFDK